MTQISELPSLEILEPFGWLFTPGSLPSMALAGSDALARVTGALGPGMDTTSLASGTYTEKGRYRRTEGGRRMTLYDQHPVWVVTTEVAAAEPITDSLSADQCSRHTVLDAHSGRPIAQFLWLHVPRALHVLDLCEPLDEPELTLDEAVAAALSGEERVLADLPRTAEYGSRWRLIPGFVQVTDVWRITFDSSGVPSVASTARRELAWVVVVDDKAGHRWLSAAVEAP